MINNSWMYPLYSLTSTPHTFHSTNYKNELTRLSVLRLQQGIRHILQSQLSPPLPRHNLGKLKKRKTSLLLAIATCRGSRHILWQYFDSYLLRREEKEKSEGLSRGGGAEEAELSKSYSRVSVKRRRTEARYPSPLALFRGHTRPGALVQLGLRLPGCSWSPLGIFSPSSAALWRSGGGLGC